MTNSNASTLTTVPSSYLGYLPACYADNADTDAATGVPLGAFYLKIFEKLLSGLADAGELEEANRKLDPTVASRAGVRELLAANVIGNLFYPRWSFLFTGDTTFMPKLSGETSSQKKQAEFDTLASYVGMPRYTGGRTAASPIEVWARAFLEWLGATVGFPVDKNWSIDDSRKLIAQAFAFGRARGTPMGMEWLLNACLAANTPAFKDVTAEPITVADCVRPTLIVRDEDAQAKPAFHLRDSYPDPREAVVISDEVGPKIVRTGIDIEVDDTQLVAYVPWRFEVDVTFSLGPSATAPEEKAAVQAYYRALCVVLDTAKPALTTYVVNFAVTGGGGKHNYSLRGRSPTHAQN
ncbi:phage tail protein [Trinickia caryophylli]|uniref:Phage tail protein (Tail_P2_I) n=1 Tax=Trinickia caryophylli TaxID=28094 RepID=A0A1X7GAD5_TRICW|nr:phage tail protein [Trinickia caryophylli]PMS11351.1 hypothetical protein C0Z17_14485 [Trinickia caryophylli]TRX17544.1 hypothetical protein FNF07_04405 [Trinickia caryophylli]WQE11709.1 phage tail protein [Trinickia caryophylli]SMF66683.1 Phage tail protein (Tail_P2_I) [Trinickia caryophylli]GLU34894.1 hypothetical protein Busp01_47360 [Trinickia caryophylli]